MAEFVTVLNSVQLGLFRVGLNRVNEEDYSSVLLPNHGVWHCLLSFYITILF